MTSLQSKLQQVQTALTDLTDNVYHYWRASATPPYLVWAEDGEIDSFNADNKKAEQQIHGTVDYYTRTEFDETVDDIQEALADLTSASTGRGWQLSIVQYEEDTGLIHYTWDWWVI